MEEQYAVYVFGRGWMTRGQMNSDAKNAMFYSREYAMKRAKGFTDALGQVGAVVVDEATLRELQTK